MLSQNIVICSVTERYNSVLKLLGRNERFTKNVALWMSFFSRLNAGTVGKGKIQEVNTALEISIGIKDLLPNNKRK